MIEFTLCIIEVCLNVSFDRPIMLLMSELYALLCVRIKYT